MFLLPLLLLLEVVVVESVTYVLRCGSFPGPCNNRCYAIYVAGLSSIATWDAPTEGVKLARRKAAGTIPNPCCGKIAGPSICWDPDGGVVPCTSPDEYPYAASLEGGTGSVIRCTGIAENTNEGSQWGAMTKLNKAEGGCERNAPCPINLAFAWVNSDAPFCTSKAGPNDGFQWTLSGGSYIQARQENGSDLVLEPHVPDPALFFPPELRREFLLDNGERVILGSRDLDKNWDDEIFFTGEKTARVVRELLGQEKSPQFRPSNIPA